MSARDLRSGSSGGSIRDVTYEEIIARSLGAAPGAASASVAVAVAEKKHKSRKRMMAMKGRKRDAKGRLLPMSRASARPIKSGTRKRKHARKGHASGHRRAAARRPRDKKGHFVAKTHTKAARKRARLTRKTPRRSAGAATSKEPRKMKHRRRNAKGRFVKASHAAPRRRRRRHVARANSAPRRRRHVARANSAPRRRRRRARRHSAREKLPGGRIRVKRHMVHYRRRNIPTRDGYTRHICKANYRRGPYTYRPSAAELAAMENPMPFAMENPLSGGEMMVMGVMGAIGFGIGSLVDRFLCTNPVTSGGTPVVLTETPGLPTFFSPGVYNQDAPDTPMGIGRWLVGLGVPAIMAVGASHIGGPWTKVVLQGTALGWGIRTLGKGLDDLMAYLLGGSSATPGSGAWGARLYAPEIQAINAVKAMSGATTALAPLTQGTYSLNTPGVQTLQGIPAIMQQQAPVYQRRNPPPGVAGHVHENGCGCDTAGPGNKNDYISPPASRVDAGGPAMLEGVRPLAASPESPRPETLGASVSRFGFGAQEAA